MRSLRSYVAAALAHVHDVGGKRRAFCSADHYIEWLELNRGGRA